MAGDGGESTIFADAEGGGILLGCLEFYRVDLEPEPFDRLFDEVGILVAYVRTVWTGF